jgi:hypothetical protein
VRLAACLRLWISHALGLRIAAVVVMVASLQLADLHAIDVAVACDVAVPECDASVAPLPLLLPPDRIFLRDVSCMSVFFRTGLETMLSSDRLSAYPSDMESGNAPLYWSAYTSSESESCIPQTRLPFFFDKPDFLIVISVGRTMSFDMVFGKAGV